MMREQIAPALRTIGMKGSGRVFELPSPEHWALVGFQKSAYSDRNAIRFTLNLTVVDRDVWAATREKKPHLPARPSGNRHYGAFLWYSRIGRLLPGGADRWWQLDPNTPLQTLSKEVVAAIQDYALPAMRAQMQ
jgi:Domain of unknown function (DUF4304)